MNVDDIFSEKISLWSVRKVSIGDHIFEIHELPALALHEYTESLTLDAETDEEIAAANETAGHAMHLAVVRALRGKLDVDEEEVKKLPSLMSLRTIRDLLQHALGAGIETEDAKKPSTPDPT